MLKRKFTIHMDALIVLVILFVGCVALTIFQLQQSRSLSDDLFRLELQQVENEMNLSSQKAYIEKLRKEIDTLKSESGKPD